ncbi:hypothetical protein CTEN210_16169 [Chaetoceros tenuissimus]|uniref:Tubulin-tyrosine ligase family protein n=1 Tax=Chaetoceros tenuissimus TaxID=426638 RepID=A0AAD3D8D2_9STRA|nr:hypothetical protein CTEN210_16169 [Chaetoceros tenuissimus]
MQHVRKHVLSFTLQILIVVIFLDAIVGFTSSPVKQPTPELIERIQNAMQLTTAGQTNITAASLAVDEWKVTRQQETFDQTLPSIQMLCNTLYASSLSRIGKDRDALRIHNETLLMMDQCRNQDLNFDTVLQTRIGRAESFIRLLNYDSAKMEYISLLQFLRELVQDFSSIQLQMSKLLYAAATCELRMGNPIGAIEMIESVVEQGNVDIFEAFDGDLIGLYGVLLYECNKNIEKGKAMIQHAAANDSASPVYKWFHDVLNAKENVESNSFQTCLQDKNAFLRLVTMNLGPFDDPALLHLDDKVFLNDLLQEETSEHCTTHCLPKGFVLPREKDELKQYYKSNPSITSWMKKERSGYGSHGNQIIEKNEIQDILGKDLSQYDDEILCQRLIEPSMLLEGRKFTIRVYVIYFQESSIGKGDDDFRILNEGLVKLAEEEFVQGVDHLNVNRMYMTNSGRIEGDGMLQYDLNALKSFMDDSDNGSFEELWKRVNESICFVMERFQNYKERTNVGVQSTTCSKMLSSSIPKILGFDYIVDDEKQPWLLEVNRFPGLEPRGAVDEAIKRSVVNLAWELASRKINDAESDC